MNCGLDQIGICRDMRCEIGHTRYYYVVANVHANASQPDCIFNFHVDDEVRDWCDAVIGYCPELIVEYPITSSSKIELELLSICDYSLFLLRYNL